MKRFRKTPYLTIILSFLGVIAVGTILLLLPISTTDGKGLSFVNSLFMSTSSVCVTGLSVIGNVGLEMSTFGKVVMAILIEIGGLSFLTLAAFVFLTLGVKLGINNRYLMKEALNQDTATGVFRLVKKIMIITFSIQIVGAFVNLIAFSKYYSFGEAVGISIFHSISAFNNAGFDICGYTDSLVSFKDDIILNFSTITLIILGGIGFIVINEIITKHSWKKFSLHTKVVLTMSLLLICIGTLILKVSMKDISFMQALFQSVAARTAGFATFDMTTLSNPAYLTMLFLMLIGASPCSTGGGLKTTTFFLVIVAIVYYIKNKPAKPFYRSVPKQAISKAYCLVVMSLLFVFVISMTISFIEPTFGIKEIVFEVVSAFGTVGYSMGLTTSLSSASKVLICITMFFGRLGPLTVINMLNKNWMLEQKEDLKYVEGKIIIG